MRILRLSAMLLAVVILSTGCSQPTSPVSPTTAAGLADQTASQPPVGLTGAIRGLNVQARSFVLVTRTGSRQVTADDRTEVWSAGVRVRFGALRDGLSVAVRAVDYGSYVLARTISTTP